MSDPSYPQHSSDLHEASLPADGSDTPTSLEQQGTADPAPHAEPTPNPDGDNASGQPADEPDGGTPEHQKDEEDEDPSASPAPGVSSLPDNTVDPDVYSTPEYKETHGHNPLEQNRGDFGIRPE